MSLGSYADQCSGKLATELATTLHADEVQWLRERIGAVGVAEFWRWRKQHAAAAAEFLAATPAQRVKKAAGRELRPLLVLAAWQMCHEAARLLSAATRLGPGASYRATAAQAALEWHRFDYDDPPPLWPWDAPDPFLEDV